jgi:hypothetical protein
MARFLAGLLVGVLLGAGGAYFVFGRKKAEPTIAAAPAADAGVADPAGKKKKGRGRGLGGAGHRAGDVGDEGGDEPIPELSAADLAPGAEGDALKARDTNLDLGAGGAEVRDLSQGEIDGTFGGAASGITSCITAARGAAPVTGTISVGLVVGPDGRVVKSRVEAPAWLLRHGLYRCVRREVSGLRFPAAGKDTVVTVPFNLS